MIKKKSIFCITVKNEAKNLKILFEVLKNNLKIFNDYFIIFVESDSDDDSAYLIKDFLRDKKGKLIQKKLSHIENRVKRLEISRNEYLKYIKKNNKLKKFDFLIVLDCGNVNDKLNPYDILTALKFKKKWVAIFPTQYFLYYDIWALRIKNFIEHDCYQILIRKFMNNKLLKKDFINLVFKFMFINFFFKKNNIEVISAYGGMAIYQLKKVINFKYNCNNGASCEHVAFNKKIYQKYGKSLYIFKKLKNSYGINLHTINIFLCAISNFYLTRFIKKIS